MVVKTTRFDKAPTYFIYGGYVFVPLTKKLLHSTRLRYMASRWPTKEKKEIVVLLKVLASELSQGNSSISFWPVEKINGKTFATFDEFYQIVENFKGDYLLLEDDEG
ncbi:MAG TPA: serine protease, partial [Campylobacterales bacterium]|nr:serine protease [Campylobacterales bacterium]